MSSQMTDPLPSVLRYWSAEPSVLGSVYSLFMLTLFPRYTVLLVEDVSPVPPMTTEFFTPARVLAFFEFICT